MKSHIEHPYRAGRVGAGGGEGTSCNCFVGFDQPDARFADAANQRQRAPTTWLRAVSGFVPGMRGSSNSVALRENRENKRGEGNARDTIHH